MNKIILFSDLFMNYSQNSSHFLVINDIHIKDDIQMDWFKIHVLFINP